MSRYIIGVDYGVEQDETVWCISKRPSKLVKFINKLLKRRDVWKIVYCGDDPDIIRKFRYRKATIKESL